MENETITGPDGVIWRRSSDRLKLVATDGRFVISNPEMSNEYLLTFAYPTDTESKVETVQDNQ